MQQNDLLGLDRDLEKKQEAKNANATKKDEDEVELMVRA
jgi:hypothetical protein